MHSAEVAPPFGEIGRRREDVRDIPSVGETWERE